jgi:hypothetical protein
MSSSATSMFMAVCLLLGTAAPEAPQRIGSAQEWRIDTLGDVLVIPRTGVIRVSRSAVHVLTHDGQSLVRVAQDGRTPPERLLLPAAIRERGRVAHIALNEQGDIWMGLAEEAVVFLVRQSSRTLIVEQVFDLSATYLALGDLVILTGRDAGVRVFGRSIGDLGVVGQAVLRLQPNRTSERLLDFAPYVPVTRTRIRLKGMTASGESIRYVHQPFRPSMPVAFGAGGTFAVSDPELMLVRVGSVESSRMRTYGDSTVGPPLTARETDRGREELNALAGKLRLPTDSLPWRVPERHVAISGVWFSGESLIVQRKTAEGDDQLIDRFDLRTGGRRRVRLPPSNRFIFSGQFVGETAIGWTAPAHGARLDGHTAARLLSVRPVPLL